MQSSGACNINETARHACHVGKEKCELCTLTFVLAMKISARCVSAFLRDHRNGDPLGLKHFTLTLSIPFHCRLPKGTFPDDTQSDLELDSSQQPWGPELYKTSVNA